MKQSRCWWWIGPLVFLLSLCHGSVASADSSWSPVLAQSGPGATGSLALRAYLVAVRESALGRVRLHLTWNQAHLQGLTGYRISVRIPGGKEIFREISSPRQRWTSEPFELSQGTLTIALQPLRGQAALGTESVEMLPVLEPVGLLAMQASASHEMPAEPITALVESRTTDQLWIGTAGGGLGRLDPHTLQIHWFSVLDGLSGQRIQALAVCGTRQLQTRSEELLVATDGGLTRIAVLDYDELRFETYEMERSAPAGEMSPSEFTAVLEDRQGVVWLATEADGLFYAEPDTFRLQESSVSASLSSRRLLSLREDSSGGLWLGNDRSLDLLTFKDGAALVRTLNIPGVLAMAYPSEMRPHVLTSQTLIELDPSTYEQVRSLKFEDYELSEHGILLTRPDRSVCVALPDRLRCYGVDRKARDTEAPELCARGQSNACSAPRAALQARDGSLWIGLDDGQGLLQFDAQLKRVRALRPNLPRLTAGIRALAVDAQQRLWVGSDQGAYRVSWENGVTRLDRQTAQKKPGPEFEGPVETPAFSAPLVLEPDSQYAAQDALFAARQEVVGFGFGAQKTCWVAYRNGLLERYRLEDTQLVQLTSRRVMENLDVGTPLNVVVQSDQLLLVGTAGAGVQVYGLNTGEAYLQVSLDDSTGLPSNTVLSLWVEGDSLYIGTSRGLRRARIQRGETGKPSLQVDPSFLDGDLPLAVRDGSIGALLVTADQELWVGTDSGLRRWQPATLSRPAGWVQDVVGGIDGEIWALSTDPSRDVWVGTARGAYRLKHGAGDDTVYLSPVRVLAGAAAVRAITRDETGTVWLGASDGLHVIPPTLEPHRYPIFAFAPLLLAMLIFGVWLIRRKAAVDDPRVTVLLETPWKLKEIPLSELALRLDLLPDEHSLQSDLKLTDQSWNRLKRMAENWPRGSTPVDSDQAELILKLVAELLGADTLTLDSFVAQPLTGTTALDIHPESSLDSAGDTFTGRTTRQESALDGLDRGAPGMQSDGNPAPSTPAVPVPAAPAHPRPAPARLPLPARSSRPRVTVPGQFASAFREVRSPPLALALCLPELPIRLNRREMPIMAVREPLPSEEPGYALLKPLRDLTLSQRYVVVLNLVNGRPLPRLATPVTRFVPLEEPVLRSLLYSPSPRSEFVRHFVRHVRVTDVSPYSSKGEVVSSSMFFGRSRELDRLTTDGLNNFLVIGARQIGKSSLLGALRRYLRENTSRTVHSFTLTQQETSLTFYRRVAVALNAPEAPRDASGFAEMLERYCGKGSPQQTIFLLDEADALFSRERDQGYPLTTVMRRLQQEGVCSFIAAGYWQLAQLVDQYHAPHFNINEVIRLEPLDPTSARELITVPMASMGLRFEPEATIGEILEATACHPHLIQFICNQLLERLAVDASPDHAQKAFSARDWAEVRESSALKDYVTRNFKSNAGLLEEVIVYATVVAFRFNMEQLCEALLHLQLELPLRLLEDALNKLKLAGILKEERSPGVGEARFAHAIPLFRTMLLQEDVAFYARKKADELREHRSMQEIIKK